MKSNATITKMILNALPRNAPAAFDMAPNVLRWELGKSQMPDTLTRIEKALRENEHIEDFTIDKGNITANQLFIQFLSR